RAATFEARGHYGFVSLGADEAPGATAFSARVEGPSGSGDVRRVLARPIGGGWQIYVGGWPAAAQGLSDLVLCAQGTNGTRELRLTKAVQSAASRIDVALVIDDSFSMRKTDPARLRVSALTLFARIAASRGVVRTLSVVAFERRPRLLLSPTPPADTGTFEQAMAGLVARGSTDLDAALILADQTLATLPDSRKIVVVLSDGRDEPGRYEDSHRRFTASRIPVYTVGLSTLADSSTLNRIAQNTGGTFSFAPDMTRLETIFQEIVLAIHPSVTIGTWDLTTDDADVPVDDSVRLLTLTLAADEDVQAVIKPPDGGAAVALRTARVSDSMAERYAPARGLWRATGLGALAATAESDLELVLFPPTGVVTDAVPQAVAALVVRDGEAMTRGCDVSLTTGTGGAQQKLDVTERGYFEGFAVPAGPGPSVWQATARGVTDAGLPFQRIAVQHQHVTPMRRDALWVQPKPLVLELDPGCTVTGRVVIAGRGHFTADVQGFSAGLVTLLPSGGNIPEGRQLELGLAVTAGRDARPGVSTGRVVVAVGTLPRAEVSVCVRIRAPPMVIGPRELSWTPVAPGQVVTGTVWAVVQAADRACRVQAVILGFDGRFDGVRDVTLGVETTRWQIVVGTAGIGSTTQLTGRVAISWGWNTVEIPWTVGVVVPEPKAEVLAEPERAPEPEQTVIPVPEPEPIIETPPPEPEADAGVVPTVAVDEPTSVTPAAAGSYNAWRIVGVLLLLLILLYLLWRMTQGEEYRLAKYFAASLVMHVLVFLLSLDLLLQTRVVTLEQISPSLAVTIGSLEEKLGFSLAPAAGAVAVKDTPSELDKQAKAELSLSAAEARAAADLAQPDLSASAVAAMEAQMRERKPDALERQAYEAEREPAPTAEASPEELRPASAKHAERVARADAARAVDLQRAMATDEAAQRKSVTSDVAAGADARQPEAATVGLARVAPSGAAPEAAHPESLGPERQASETAAVAAETVTLAAGAQRRAAPAATSTGSGAAAATVARASDAVGGAAQRKSAASGVAAGADARQPEAATVGLARVAPGGAARGAAPDAAHPESLGPERQASETAA
ncbi:MAG: VWA domain-containing protein, partial [Lentisphaerota bacterium]